MIIPFSVGMWMVLGVERGSGLCMAGLGGCLARCIHKAVRPRDAFKLATTW